MRDVASSVLVSLSGSFQTTPTYFLDWQSGVNYNLVTMTPQYLEESLQDLQNTPIRAPSLTGAGILAGVAAITRSQEPQALSHYNIRRVIDIYGAVQDRDLGAVGRDITRIVNAHRARCRVAASLPCGDSWRPWAPPTVACWVGSSSRSSWCIY
jgi:multidrug efflux pump subunit AcrB